MLRREADFHHIDPPCARFLEIVSNSSPTPQLNTYGMGNRLRPAQFPVARKPELSGTLSTAVVWASASQENDANCRSSVQRLRPMSSYSQCRCLRQNRRSRSPHEQKIQRSSKRRVTAADHYLQTSRRLSSCTSSLAGWM
jgi:hypothetical protein